MSSNVCWSIIGFITIARNGILGMNYKINSSRSTTTTIAVVEGRVAYSNACMCVVICLLLVDPNPNQSTQSHQYHNQDESMPSETPPPILRLDPYHPTQFDMYQVFCLVTRCAFVESCITQRWDHLTILFQTISLLHAYPLKGRPIALTPKSTASLT